MYQRILIVVSDRPEARIAIQEGTELARVHQAEALFLCVLPGYLGTVAEMSPVAPMPVSDGVVHELRRQGQRLLADASAQAQRAGVRSRTSLHENVEAVNCITSTVHKEHCDLIVVGAEQRNAVMRIITGSVVPGLITRAPVPVLVCHEPSDATNPSA